MNDLALLEECFKKFILNLERWAPEGIIEVDIRLLEQLDILDAYNQNPHDYQLTHSFQFIESDDKITLLSDQFVVWIVPENIDGAMATFTLIAINHPHHPKLELVFVTKGIYNTSNLVLRVLEKLLIEIQDNETALATY